MPCVYTSSLVFGHYVYFQDNRATGLPGGFNWPKYSEILPSGHTSFMTHEHTVKVAV